MKKDKSFILLTFTVFSAMSITYAGVTGKVTGRVMDANTGDPLMGVNVVLKNTPQGAATDEGGNYIILNVRGGKYTLVATMIGYKTVEVVDVRVLADHTSTVDINMEQTAIEGEEVTITAERPVIVRDETATTNTVLAEEIENMPVNSYLEVLDNVAGVVENNNGRGDDGIHIRGGRSNEIAYMVDGFFVEDAIYGGMGTDVSRAGISELSVITGAFNAEYGEAMSGVVNILTKEGGPNFGGHIRVTTDQLGFYDDTERPMSDWNTSRYEGSIGGPVLLLPRNFATFFASGDVSNTETYLGRTKHDKVPFHDYNGNGVADDGEYLTDEYDLDGDGDTEELLVKGHIHKNSTFQDQTRLNAKLAIRPFSSVKITAGGIFNRTNQRNYSISYKLHPDNIAPIWRESDLFYVSLNHSLSPRTFYSIKWSEFNRRSWDGLREFMRVKEKLFGTERDLWTVADVEKIHRLGNGEFIWKPYEPFFDANGNGEFDDGELFSDVDGDGAWTAYVFDTGADGIHAESFTDTNGDRTWEPDEPFVDSNGDGIWNGPDEGERDGLPTAGEPGVVDLWWSYYAEPFKDTPDGIYRDGSADILVYDADQDGIYDAEDGDYFIDLSGDGVWREGEEFVDLDGDGHYDYGITPPRRGTAFEGESNYEFLGSFTAYDLNGKPVRETTSQDNFYEKYASRSSTWEGSFTSQVTEHHQLKFGGEYKSLVLEDFRNS
ncbi:MAG: carboxypeptidase-like regulatory domain-containing protein, partial [Fidelibacterota bacterium]